MELAKRDSSQVGPRDDEVRPRTAFLYVGVLVQRIGGKARLSTGNVLSPKARHLFSEKCFEWHEFGSSGTA